MKKTDLLAAVAAISLCAAPAFALDLAEGEDGGGPGCGLGTQIHQGKSGLLPQILAASTNGTFSQPSAITTGTSGCDASVMVFNDIERRVFARANFRNLKQDVARGEGEYLTSLASLMGVEASDQRLFEAFAQDRFAELSVESADTFLTSLDRALLGHSELARYVPAAR
ncbi:MAG: DUF3015 domain-containing protein [Nitrospirota bacterium]|nr:DUF3015 domain-containing protein [Nitrospirota bacterium]